MSITDFQWMTGFECSAFPQLGTDELDQTQHYRWFASDLVRLRDAAERVRHVLGPIAEAAKAAGW